jgi:hypothetical protein
VRTIALMALAIVASACLGRDHHASSGLRITVRVATSAAATAQGEVAFRTERYSLTCGRPPRGTMPNPANACTAVADLGLPHSPTSCEGQRGPVLGSVSITGSFRGKPVHLRITSAQWCGASADLRQDYAALLLPDPAVVPDVVGLPVLRAAGVLQRAGFTVSITTSMVFGSLTPMPLADGQSMTAGVLAERGSDVALTLRPSCCVGSHVGTPHARMPRLVGLDARHAIRRLRNAGLNWVMRLRSVDTAAGPILGSFVVQQSPRPGSSLIGRNGGIRLPEFTADYGQSSNG